MIIDEKYIEQLSYSDFVGLINQWNVLPGAYSTLSRWTMYSNLNKNSYILEMGCTTGFSSREIAVLSGCNGIGIDISKQAIKMAIYNKEQYTPKVNIKYLCCDAYKYKSKKTFSHIIIGAALKFFPDPNEMLKKCLSLLTDYGYILASPFYVTKKIPGGLIQKAQNIFNITPTNESYKEIMSLYKGLEIVYEDRNNIIPETEEELNHYCSFTTEGACNILKITDNKIEQAIYDRLYSIKKMSNELRPYQNYTVLVLRFRKKIFPGRFVELF